MMGAVRQAPLEQLGANGQFLDELKELPLASHDVPIGSSQVSLAALNERSREIFRQIVESYLATGEPLGSRNLSRILPITLSPASVRNVMSDLEQLGLIFAPHTSAGRLPTELGLRFFVDALMQVGDLTEENRRSIEAQVAGAGANKSIEAVLTEASQMLSGLTRSAGVVLTAKNNVRLKHIEFVRLEPERALAVLVAEDGQVENRVLNVPAGLPSSALVEAANFLNARIRGKTLADLRGEIESAVAQGKAELDQLTQRSSPRVWRAGPAVIPRNASSSYAATPICSRICTRSTTWSGCARCSMRWRPSAA
jgi:heat-inducible transcriptional repressor